MKLFPLVKFSWLKAILPHGLFARSLLILVLPILLIQIILAFVFFDNHWNRITDRLAYAVAGEVAVMLDLIENPDGRVEFFVDTLQDLNSEHLELNTQFRKGVSIDEEQEEFSGWGIFVGRALLREIKARVNLPYRVLIDMQDKEVLIKVAVKGGVLITEVPLRRLFSSTAYIFLLWMGGVSIVLLVVAILFMRNQIRPIKRLAVAADWFGKGRDVSFFKVSGSKEVRLAAQSFLDMKERINKQVQQRTSMLAGVSHDLRTPLTRMKLQLEMMGQDKDILGMKSDLSDMERMIDAYLQFARGEGDEETQDTDVVLLLSRCAETNSSDNFKVSVKAEGEGLVIPLRSFAFERCVTNILSNAKRFATKAEVRIARKKDIVQIHIDDNGEGIPKSERNEVFKPFYRGDKSRNASSGSVGLGLNIAQDIILSHGGDIYLGDSPQGGLRVTIDLPV
jgi:two-component system osmolarity sensor histidine kinase EnvZ